MDILKKICVFSLILSFFLVPITVVATEHQYIIYEYPDEDATVYFSENTTFDECERKNIADSIVYDTPMGHTYSLCWLLGHDLYVETLAIVYHERSEYDPRCQLETYDIEKCNNCDYAYPRLISSCYISCCPPDASAVSLDD